jgi:hypothetical protein
MRSEYIIGFSLLVLSGCQLPVINGKKNFFDYRNERIAIIAFKAADNVPETVWDGMLNSVEQELQDHPEVSQAFFAKDAPVARVPESNLAVRLQRFKTTLSLTGIVDRDLAVPLQEDLEVNLLFILQLEDYSCSKDCPGNRQFLMRLKLLDFRSGELLYQARLNYQLDEEEEEGQVLSQLVTNWNGRLLNRWASDFKTPWHRWRYENLKTLAVNSGESE